VARNLESWKTLPDDLTISYCDIIEETVGIYSLEGANGYSAQDAIVYGFALVGLASLFYLGFNAIQKTYQPIEDQSEV
jgi:hypothetical protein